MKIFLLFIIPTSAILVAVLLTIVFLPEQVSGAVICPSSYNPGGNDQRIYAGEHLYSFNNAAGACKYITNNCGLDGFVGISAAEQNSFLSNHPSCYAGFSDYTGR